MLPFRVGPDELTCPLSVHLQYGSLGLVRKLLDSDSCDLDTDVRLENGRTVLLDYVFNHHRKNPQVIAMLLEKGADVHARDRDGNTCLHLYFKRLEQDMPSYNRDCLLSLIRSGADISAKNNLGWTVAETVGCGHLSRGYATDLWNTTLSHCGYDSADLRVSIPDKSRISWSYTALYYAALLRGDSWDEDDSRRWVEPHSYFTWKCLESVLPPLEFNLTSRISLQSDIWDTSHEELGLEHLSSTSTLSNDLSNMWNTIPELLRSLVISTHRPSV